MLTPNWYKTKVVRPRDESPMPLGLWNLTHNMERDNCVPVDPVVMRAQKEREATEEEDQRKAAHMGATAGNLAVPQNAGGIG